MECILDNIGSYLIGKTSLDNVKNKTELRCHIRDAAELVSEIYNDNSSMEKHMLTDLSLAVGSLIAMDAGVKPEYALPALGVFILSDTFLGILSYVNTAGGNESFAGKGISPANP